MATRVTRGKRLQNTSTGRLAGSVKRAGRRGGNKLKATKGTVLFKSSLAPTSARGRTWERAAFGKSRTGVRAGKIGKVSGRARMRRRASSYSK